MPERPALPRTLEKALYQEVEIAVLSVATMMLPRS